VINRLPVKVIMVPCDIYAARIWVGVFVDVFVCYHFGNFTRIRSEKWMRQYVI